MQYQKNLAILCTKPDDDWKKGKSKVELSENLTDDCGLKFVHINGYEFCFILKSNSDKLKIT